uniref:Uncharacterized protein n=1 Tax=Arundo donax TaxID=35708 RepID=A0A0A9FE54_ARUDO
MQGMWQVLNHHCEAFVALYHVEKRNVTLDYLPLIVSTVYYLFCCST